MNDSEWIRAVRTKDRLCDARAARDLLAL